MGGLVSYFFGYGAPAIPRTPGDDIPNPETGLSQYDVRLVTDTWYVIKQDIRGNGISLFMRYFTQFPHRQKLFKSFADVPLSELRNSKRLLAHTNNVMYAFTSIVDNLNDPELSTEMLLKTGENHGRRKVGQVEFNELKEAFVSLLKDQLGPRMTPDAEAAWGRTVKFVFKQVFKGMDLYAKQKH